MPTVVELLRPWLWPRVAALALMTVGVTACSGDSTRFNDNTYAQNPYGSRNPNEVTGSVASAPAGRVESRPLPATAQQFPPPTANRPGTVASGTAGGGKGMASYNPAPAHGSAPAQVAPRPSPGTEITGSVAPAPRPAPSGHWTWEGGTPITVASGDTIDTLARRYGVPASAIMQANNLTAPATIYPGQPLVIPRYNQSPVAAVGAPPARAPAVTAPRPARVAPAMGTAAVGNSGVHIVAPGETLSRISRLYGKSLAELARANRLAPSAHLRVGDRIIIPGVQTSKRLSKAAIAQAKPAAPAAPKEPANESISVAQVPELPTGANPSKSAEATGALPTFRWPARGRVIAGYGPTPNGVQNDGINIALPEGTPVKAAEDGTVAYAGNELKGYGNLVLIRHPNGYVTAYAHAKELMVKRGDQIKRGQVIARSGQTGNINAPQLHFEIRKGAAPLDPTRFLSGG